METLAVRPNMIQAFREACRLGRGEIVLKQDAALKLLSEIEQAEADIRLFMSVTGKTGEFDEVADAVSEVRRLREEINNLLVTQDELAEQIAKRVEGGVA